MIEQKDIDIIDQFLNDKLNGEALLAFNNRVKSDTEFAEELELMKNISAGIKNYGRQELKNKLKSIAKKERKQKSKQIIYWSIAASFLLLIGISGYFYFINSKPVEQKFAFNNIIPPFKNADVKYKEYQLEAGKGAVLSYHTGTIITVPKNAFVDKKGKVVQGNISVKYRELNTPEELFIAGIPMSYDSSGHALSLQTAGLCELQVYKNDSLINIATDNEIKIDISSKAGKDYSLLLFDTVSKKWLKKNNDTNVVKLDEYAENTGTQNMFVPRKANHSRPRFKLVYRDPLKFPEFEEYKNYSFEISENEKNYDPSEANKNWKSVSIKKDNVTGEYLVTFINSDKQITYRTHTVFEDKDYLAALNIYNNKLKEQQEKSMTGKDPVKLKNANRIKDLQKELLKNEKDDFVAANIYRTISVSKAGLWCYSKIIDKPIGASHNIDFKDNNGTTLNLKYIAVLNHSKNTIFRYTPEEFNTIRFDTTSGNVLVAITSDNSFAYLKNEDYAKLPKTGDCNVILKIATKKPETSAEIISLIS